MFSSEKKFINAVVRLKSWLLSRKNRNFISKTRFYRENKLEMPAVLQWKRWFLLVITTKTNFLRKKY